MDTDSSEIVVGLTVAVFGLIGLFLIAGAADDEIYIFGLGLAVFAVCFDFGLLKRHFDRRDHARAILPVEVQVSGSGGSHHG